MKNAAAPTATKPHRYRSKVKTRIGPDFYTFRLSAEGLTVRRWRSRRIRVISFNQLTDAAMGQFTLL